MKTLRLLVQFSVGACLICASLAATPPLPAAPPTVVCSPDRIHTAAVGDAGRIVYRQSCDNSIKNTFYACHVQALAFSPGGEFLGAFSGRNGNPGKVKVWRLSDGCQLCEITTSIEAIHVLALSDDGSLVVAVGSNGHLAAWRVSTGTLQWSHTLASPAESVEFTANGKRLRVQFAQGEKRVFDLTTGRRSPSLETAKN